MKDSDALLSIVIPMYNAEKYIGRCIRSIVDQIEADPQLADKIEIIIIDDGSTDSSISILNSIINKKDPVRVISQQNAGVSTARNNGKKAAKGKYIYIS